MHCEYWKSRRGNYSSVSKELLALTGSKSKVVFKPLPVDDPRIRQPDISKARKILNWEPRILRKEGLGKDA